MYEALIMASIIEKEVGVLEEKAALQKTMLRGRQVAWYIFDKYRISAEQGHVYDFEDILHVSLNGNNLRGFINDWEMALSGMSSIPDESVLEALFKTQLLRADNLKEVLAATYNFSIVGVCIWKQYIRSIKHLIL
mgnify:CR=1 FL=1